MAEVTYFVALPFVISEDDVAAGEPTECLNPAIIDLVREQVLWCVGIKYPSCEVFVCLITEHDVLEARFS